MQKWKSSRPIAAKNREGGNYKAHSLKLLVYLYKTNAVMSHSQPGEPGEDRVLWSKSTPPKTAASSSSNPWSGHDHSPSGMFH